MEKDWIGNSKSTFVTLGASNHSDGEREKDDFYSTDPNSLEIFLKALERDGVYLSSNIWECACGMGHLSKVLEKYGYSVLSTDLVDRGHGSSGIDFLSYKEQKEGWFPGDILTNPPYKYAKEFVETGLKVVKDGFHVVMYLKIQFLEGKGRRELFDKYPPKYVYVNSARQLCYPNGDMSKKMSGPSCFCWFVWEKGYKGEPIIRWI